MNTVIQLQDIHKTYHTGDVEVHAVRGVSLEIAQGEFVALMGASGSGKSTMMNIIGCLDRPTGGKYLLDGIDVSQLSRDELADIRNQKIGFVFQGFNLLARTSALENVELPMLYTRQRLAGHEPARAGLARRWKRSAWPTARTTSRTSSPAASSSASPSPARWPTSPRLLLADEPTGNLDTPHQRGHHGRVPEAQRPGHDHRHGDPRAGHRPATPSGWSSCATAKWSATRRWPNA